MISDPHFDAVIADVIHDTTEEAVIVSEAHEGRVIESPAIINFCRTLASQLPLMHHNLITEHPDADFGEAVLGLTQLTWDYGFRAGRIFQARGHEVPGEDTFGVES